MARFIALPLMFAVLALGCQDDTVVSTTGTETSASSSSGDGDGDPSGDGDGDPSGDGDGDPSGDGDGEPSGDGDGEPSGDGDGEPGPCSLWDQDCGEGLSCYPTFEGSECLPTGSGGLSREFLDPCASHSDCAEGFFCNPENFNHCVPFCMLGTECVTGFDCNEPGQNAEFIGLPEGVGWCYPWPP